MSNISNLALINKLSFRLRTVAAHALQKLTVKGLNPFITIPEKTKEGELATQFDLKFRNNQGKVVENAEAVAEVIEPFTKKKTWKINVNGSVVYEGNLPIASETKKTATKTTDK